jgi:hypothetical protein
MFTTAIVAYLYRLAVLAADDCGVRHLASSTVSPLRRVRWRATRLRAMPNAIVTVFVGGVQSIAIVFSSFLE